MRRIHLSDTDGQLGELLQQVCAEQQPLVLEQDARPVAVLLTPQQFEEYRAFVTQRFMDTLRAIHDDNADTDPDEVMRVVTEVVEQVRQAAYERSIRDQGRP